MRSERSITAFSRRAEKLVLAREATRTALDHTRDLSATGDETAVPPPVREQTYLVMREAVRNAVAHSGCGRVGVSVEVDGVELRGAWRTMVGASTRARARAGEATMGRTMVPPRESA
jgi:signal transduction histidine kinase